jgi:hypothetical protein
MSEPDTNWVPTPGDDRLPNVSETPPPLIKPRQRGVRLSNALLTVAAIVAVGGLTFAVGRVTAPGQTGNGLLPGDGTGPTAGQFPNASFAPGAGLVGASGLTLNGTVEAIDGSTLTLTTTDGQTVSVDLSGTMYHRQADAAADDVSAGASVKVTVEGQGGPGGVSPGAVSSGARATLTATDVTLVTQ